MRGFWPIFKRELFSLWVTPLAWVLLTTFLVVQGIHFSLLVNQFALDAGLGEGGPLPSFFGKTVIFYLPPLFICPLLTMRLFAEERRAGTIEPLLTAPVGTTGLVLAKYLAALATYVILWAPTFLYVVLVRKTGEVDMRVVGASYLGVFGIGAGYIAIGTMTSALTSSQLTAAVLAAMGTAGLFIAGVGEFVFDRGTLHDLASYVSAWSQMNDFSQGIIDLRRLVFDATLVVLPLFITVRTVDSWRWG